MNNTNLNDRQCLVLTFLCWWIWEFWKSHKTRVFQKVPRPSIVSSESRCLDALRQLLAGEIQDGRMVYASPWFSPRSLHKTNTSTWGRPTLFNNVSTVNTGNDYLQSIIIVDIEYW